MKSWTAPPEAVPTYPGDMQAIAAIENVGWTVWWDNTGFGQMADATAIHPTNPASPMRLHHHEYSAGHTVYWWRPMIRMPHRPIRDLTRPGGVNMNRVNTYYPVTLEQMARKESA